ncbi:speract receptor-like [Glandiceps talaboti]
MPGKCNSVSALRMCALCHTLALFTVAHWIIISPATAKIVGDTIKIGLMVPLYGEENSRQLASSAPGAFDLAVEHANERNIINNTKIEWTYKNTNCSINNAMLDILEYWREGYFAIVGPGCSCVHEGRVASSISMPLVAYMCNDDGVNDKGEYEFRTFYRAAPHGSNVAHPILALYKAMDWKITSIIASDEAIYHSTYSMVKTVFGENGVIIHHYETFRGRYSPDGNETSPFPNIIKSTKDLTRIYLFLGEVSQLRQFAVDMYTAGLLASGEYMIVGISIDYQFRRSQDYLAGTDPSIVDKVFKSVFIIEVQRPNLAFEELQAYRTDMQIRSALVTGMQVDLSMWDNRAFYVYDAVILLSTALNNAFASGIYSQKNMVPYFGGVTFDSITNISLQLNASGHAIGEYDLLNYRTIDEGTYISDGRPTYTILGSSKGMVRIGNFPYQTDGSRMNLHDHKQQDPALFVGQGINTPRTSRVQKIITMICHNRKRQYKLDLDNMVWIVTWKSIKFEDTEQTTQAIGMKSMATGSMSPPNILGRQIQIGKYKGKVCAVKTINKQVRIELSGDQRVELKRIRDLHHPNLNRFIGACPYHPHICILMEYCSRGSLQDILANTSIELDSMFRASLIADIVKGMKYLHGSPIKQHGNLTSSNCVVDNRWVLKLTDFGMHLFRQDEILDYLNEEDEYRNTYWQAPECLRHPGILKDTVVQKADTYSFGMVLTEIYTREIPYYFNDEDPEVIFERVKNVESPPFRADIADMPELAPECVMETLDLCWAEDPDRRPSFSKIRRMLSPLHDGLKQNIMDNVIDRMEKYTDNLEQIVDDRTEELKFQKDNTEELLSRMLPSSIAAQLIKGITVLPEAFDMVTIYFSDIVGFSAMSAVSTPHQIVDFLNDLYSLFDGIIENYDVYKVETIGDGYVIVSGLPTRNGIYHAGEIASTALHLLSSVATFKIRHRHDDILKLRIGIHSGPIVACVVGLTNPRYCLFGDTINTTSRMQSNGLALKIHVSTQCKEILDKIGGYATVERGFVTMKGKGEVKTHWLIDQDPSFRKEPHHQ